MSIQLGYPHSSDVRGVKASKRGKKPALRELRPRQGKSSWRPLYMRIKDTMFILAMAPDGQDDPRGYEDALSRARMRLMEMEGAQ